MNQNYQFYLNLDVSEYVGEWIAINDNKVLAHGKSITKVFKKAAKQSPHKSPLIARVPEKGTSIFKI
jgi:uncharacterized protein DUF5678